MTFVHLSKKPLEVEKEGGLFIVVPAQAEELWRISYYIRVGQKVNQLVGMKNHSISAGEVVKQIRTFSPTKIVMERSAYQTVFRDMFNTPTVPHILAVPMDNIPKVTPV